MKIEIICNEKGTGKTTFVLKHFSPYKYFVKETLDVIEFDDVVENKEQLFYCIIDSADTIPEKIFNILMNRLILLQWKAIIIVFDIPKEQLIDCSNFNMIWECGFIPTNYEYTNFIAENKSFYDFLHEHYSKINPSFYDNIIQITNYNFKKMDRLMIFNQLCGTDTEKIDTKALTKYIEEVIQINYKDIPDADILLKKASIIGEQFICDALESPDGFGYDVASSYLKQMEEMKGFVRHSINVKEQYEFISHDIYQGIFSGITNENKISWIEILIKYYKSEYEHCIDASTQFFILNKLKNLFKFLPLYRKEQKNICFLLFYEYRKINNDYKALEIAKEIIETLASVINIVEYAFIQNYRIKILMQNGEYRQALEILEKIYTVKNYPGSKMFISYYYAFCLYETGNVDLAYKIVEEIVQYLKNTSGSNKHSQELFCITYSLMATIQNHLGLEDRGIKYFRLALNNANKLKNKVYFYNILKKCDMFYEYPQTKECLEKCLDFYVNHDDRSSAGEVYVNLATEMLFQDGTNIKKIKEYFNSAITYFCEYNNEKLAYAKNNLGIYYSIVEDNITEGLRYFKEALLVGLSDFSYMSIYLNICMCYILLNRITSDEFLDAKIHFNFVKKKLSKRQHESVYEKIYEELLEIIIEEHQGKDVLQRSEAIIDSLNNNSFFKPLLRDIIKRNSLVNDNQDSCYKDNTFYYKKMNQLRCFFAEFRFWE